MVPGGLSGQSLRRFNFFKDLLSVSAFALHLTISQTTAQCAPSPSTVATNWWVGVLGDHGGQRLHFVFLIFEVPQCSTVVNKPHIKCAITVKNVSPSFTEQSTFCRSNRASIGAAMKNMLGSRLNRFLLTSPPTGQQPS